MRSAGCGRVVGHPSINFADARGKQASRSRVTQPKWTAGGLDKQAFPVGGDFLTGSQNARVFASALRIFQGDAEFLRARLLEAALESDAVAGEFDDYGQRYIVDFECVSGGLRAIIRSAWIVRRGEHFPRLTTCYVLSN